MPSSLIFWSPISMNSSAICRSPWPNAPNSFNPSRLERYHHQARPCRLIMPIHPVNLDLQKKTGQSWCFGPRDSAGMPGRFMRLRHTSRSLIPAASADGATVITVGSCRAPAQPLRRRARRRWRQICFMVSLKVFISPTWPFAYGFGTARAEIS